MTTTTSSSSTTVPPPTTSSSSSATTTTTSKSTAVTAPSHNGGGIHDGVPIFLRKTYHMIDTCDTAIACWAEDGETFVVKDPTKFEKIVIPQFFKHSKFTSFVRQLNFYSFRKIKYADTIRIDPQLEAETANFWRFRHEKFQRGKPELLLEIKRMNGGQKSNNNNKNSQQQGNSEAGVAATPDVPLSSSSSQQQRSSPPVVVDVALKSEVNSLKKSIEAMTKNIDQLTSLVEKVSLKQEQQQQDQQTSPVLVTSETLLSTGNKRKKADTCDTSLLFPDERSSAAVSMDIDAELDFPSSPFLEQLTPPSPPPSSSPILGDDEFVDQLFNAFGNEDEALLWDEPLLDSIVPEPPSTTAAGVVRSSNNNTNNNMPDPELMQRLSDALSLLPREIQELIVDRLIAAITCTDHNIHVLDTNTSRIGAATALADSIEADGVASSSMEPISSSSSPMEVPASPQHERPATTPAATTTITLPMSAAATLAALVAHYSNSSNNNTNKTHTTVQKSLPVIPVHA